MRLVRKQSEDSASQDDPPKKKPKSIEVSKVEVSDNIAKFFATKGFLKKKWIVVKEIPLLEIERIEKFGNKLSVTWKGVTDTFFTKKKIDIFSKLVGQVNRMLEDVVLEDQRKTKENSEKASLRRSELLDTINTSVGIIDQSFNVLISLNAKRINWERLEGYSKDFEKNPSFTGKTIPPLSLDFSKISSATKNKLPKETSDEAYNILKVVYGYFNDLKLEDDLKENHPNFVDAKAVILAYFTLNDILLGKVVGDKKITEEINQLEGVLQNLAAETNFKVNIDELMYAINKIDVDSNRESAIESSREIFKQQLKQQLKPKEESLTTTQPVVKSEVVSEPVAVAEPVKSEVVSEPVVKGEEKPKSIEVSKVEVSDNVAKFFAARGFFRKHWIVVKEIPLLEIERIKKFGNELSVTWKGATYIFFSKQKTDIFGKLVDQVNGILEGINTEPAVIAEPSPASAEPVSEPEAPAVTTDQSLVAVEPPSNSAEPVAPAADVSQPAPEASMPQDSSRRSRARKKRGKANSVS